MTYAVVTPARNERENLRRLADSLAAQTLPPAEWLIVENGSDDGTPALAEELAAETQWIRWTRIDSSGALVRGGTVTRPFQHGVERLRAGADVIVKVDADVSFPPDYFEALLRAFAAEPRLGIASGVCHELAPDGEWRPRFLTGESAWGAARAYRANCLRDVLPLEDSMGWDGIDSLKADLRGWRTQTLPQLEFRHHRKEGERDGSRRRAWEAQGRAAHYMGYRPWYLLARTALRMRAEPAAAWMPVAFAKAWLRREPRCADASVRAHLRSQQRLRVLPVRLREARGEGR